MRRQLRRAQVLGFMRGLLRCAVGIEAPKIQVRRPPQNIQRVQIAAN